MTIQEYVDILNTRYKTGISREHSYRGDLQTLLSAIATDVLITNEPARIACGAPDYIITKGKSNIPVGYIEAKDIGKPLNSKDYKEQFDRYRSLPNLIITDYLEFQLYVDGEFKTTISIAEIQGNKIVAKPENFESFTLLIKNFCIYVGQTIKSASKLAKMMANNARLMATIIENALNSDEETQANSTLKDQMLAFKQILIHDINNKTFADIYAQTIAYGMFAARYHDPTLPTFSREEAAMLIPKSNPFLRKLFQYIAGYDLDTRIAWIIDALIDVFLSTDVADILKHFGKSTQQNDPVIHFYETFLTEYDPALRKSRGVWYTPEPVVNFIVRAVDDILKTEFDLPQGLADTSKIKIKTNVQGNNKTIEQEVHRVQILDPAAGTGTFLAEVVKHIYKKFEGQQGIWSNYVEEHLIPRLNGFEILMASYAMAHLKLDMLFTETGYKPSSLGVRGTQQSAQLLSFGGAGGPQHPSSGGAGGSQLPSSGGVRGFQHPSSGGAGGGLGSQPKEDQRFRIYLTNSLEEHHPDTGTLFASWLSTEANEANHIKRDTPVMVVLGNPPYSVSSNNKSQWIENLTTDYKKDLNERNIQPLSDDYIKFIRFGQHFIDKNGSGVLAYISNNSFIDGLIHRQMRKYLLESFDKIFILDLHGNAKKQDICIDGTPDQNVFDIMQGVSINIFIKTGKKKKNELGVISYFELQGKREFKYDFLSNNSFKNINWNKLELKEPNLFFVKKELGLSNVYEKGVSLTDLFPLNNAGLATEYDEFVLKDNLKDSQLLLEKIKTNSSFEIRLHYNLDVKKLSKIEQAINDIKANKPIITEVNYRPFDVRYSIYTGKSNGIMGRPRDNIMKHLLKENISLIFERQATIGDFTNIFISHKIVECHILGTMFSKGYVAPLYLYPETNAQQTIGQTTKRTPNLNPEIVKQIADKIGLTFINEKETNESTFAPIDILDYIYAILHSPTYREKYKEFLKIDFPRVPYPKDKETFWQLVKLGGELRQIHLLESPVVEKRITTYLQTGNNVVEGVRFEATPVLLDPTPALPKREGENPTSALPRGEGVRPGYVTANPLTYKIIKEYRAVLKNNPTEAEKVIWEYLRNKKTGHKIRRQHVIDDFITDFVCLRKKVVIEIDGKIHDFQKDYDTLRSIKLNALGYEVIRFTNDEVIQSPQKVADSIKVYLNNKEDLAPEDTDTPPLSEGQGEVSSNTPPPEGQGEVSSPPSEGQGEVKEGLGEVWINTQQYFDGVPKVAWNFYIGGYQPAQKWLKDRKGRELSFEDILHYQKIIVALAETDRLMKEIDIISIE